MAGLHRGVEVSREWPDGRTKLHLGCIRAIGAVERMPHDGAGVTW